MMGVDGVGCGMVQKWVGRKGEREEKREKEGREMRMEEQYCCIAPFLQCVPINVSK